MSSVRSGVQIGAACAVLACVCVLFCEARRSTGTRTWFALSAGIGIGAECGVEDGWFAWDARLESFSDGAYESPIGAAIGAGSTVGAFTLAPLPR